MSDSRTVEDPSLRKKGGKKKESIRTVATVGIKPNWRRGGEKKRH